MDARSTPVLVCIALGSNRDDPVTKIRAAIDALGAGPVLADVRASSLVWTQPVGPVAQPDFLNAAVIATTTRTPDAVLAFLQGIEAALGRRRDQEVRFGPRPIDLDLLLVGETVCQTPWLELPHPRMHERRFVLEPLVEVAPDVRHPQYGATIRELLERL